MSHRTPLIWPALTATLALFLLLTVALQLGASPTSSTTTADAVAPTDAPRVLEVTLAEWSIEGDLTAPSGQPLRFEVRNAGTLPHDLTLVASRETTGELAGGADGVLEVEGLEPGTYQLHCSLAGHEPAGMSATLTVADGVQSQASETGRGGPEGDHPVLTAQEMVEHHNDGIAKFLDGWGGTVYGNNALEPTVDDDGAKVFELIADEIEWETKPGVTRSGMAFNGQIPGPMIRASVGDRIKILLTNAMGVPTAIHSHGLLLPNSQDGVPGITQDPVMPGATFTYDFVLRNAGSHMYHSHFDAATQVPGGLLGALIVDDPGRPVEEDIDYTMILNDGPLGFTINGKDFPATEPIVAARGETVRVRFMNEGLQIHPMHLHGMPMTVIEKDGYPLPQPYRLDTLNVAPGERFDVVIEAEEPGAWALHCHILNHAEGPDGMFGMVTALVVQ